MEHVMIELWDLTGQKLFTLKVDLDGFKNVVLNATDDKILFTGEDGIVKIWPIIEPQNLIDLARKNVPRQLTKEQKKEFFLQADN